MVDGSGSPGTQKTLRSFFTWAAVSSSRSAHPICGFCRLATGMAEGRSAGEPDFLLEERIGWSALHPGTAYRQTASRHTKLPWGHGDFSSARKAAGATENFVPGTASHIVYGSGSRLHGFAAPLHRPGRHRRWDADLRQNAQRDRKLDRLVSEHVALASEIH